MFFLAFAEGGSIQLLPDGTMIFHMLLILVMIAILNRTFFKPINQIISSREKKEAGGQTEADGILKDAASKQAEYTEAVKEARGESYEMIENIRNEAVKEKQRKIEHAKSEVATNLATRNDALDTQIESTKNEIASEAKQLAERISTNLLPKN